MSDQDFSVEWPERLRTDHLVIGAGAMGMAFTDVILTEDPSATVAVVDRRPRPGGHWNDAYPFVALHQPAAFYGLNSTALGTGGSDLASGPEIVAYYHRAMQRWVASGRVRFFPSSEVRTDDDGGISVVSILDRSRSTTVDVSRRVVDAAFMNVEVPSTHGPRYDVDPEVAIVPPNGLARIDRAWDGYTIVGAGKTGIDSILFLLDRGVDPDAIRWIMPNDSWLWDRPGIQPGSATDGVLDLLDAVGRTSSATEAFEWLEAKGSIHRIDRDHTPTKWRCATMDPGEVTTLRRVDDVVRQGRVVAIGPDKIECQEGTVAAREGHLYVDCTADGLAKLPPRPIFEPGRITLQSVFMCQQVFSAAILARLSLLDTTDEARNDICSVVPHPEVPGDLGPCVVASAENVLRLHRHIPLWMRRSRLNFMHHDTWSDYLSGAARAAKCVFTARRSIARQ